MANKLKKKEWVVEEMDLKPFMNLMVVLIPLLLASAEFAKIATIEMQLPVNRGSQTNAKQQDKPEEEPNLLLLTCVVSDSALTIMAKNGILPSIYYKEYHDYVSKETGESAKMVEYYPTKLNPETMEYSALPKKANGENFSIHDREEIHLMAWDTDDNNNYSVPLRGWYNTETQELLTLQSGEILRKQPTKGKQYYALLTRMSPPDQSDPELDSLGNEIKKELEVRRLVTIDGTENFEERDLSAYDVVKSLLVKIREKYVDAEDRNSLIVSARDHVVYDKIIQVMDASRRANLTNISISPLRLSQKGEKREE